MLMVTQVDYFRGVSILQKCPLRKTSLPLLLKELKSCKLPERKAGGADRDDQRILGGLI